MYFKLKKSLKDWLDVFLLVTNVEKKAKTTIVHYGMREVDILYIGLKSAYFKSSICLLAIHFLHQLSSSNHMI